MIDEIASPKTATGNIRLRGSCREQATVGKNRDKITRNDDFFNGCKRSILRLSRSQVRR
jgi:hypothetical protein